MAAHPQLKIKIQLHSGEEIAMGPGKAQLLEAIRQSGSISAAARTMDMSYRRAWLLVDTMNRCWAQPLVLTAPGRAGGSGARLSETGESVLAHYRALASRVEAASHGAELEALRAMVRDEPRDHQRD